jgi:sugar lactone lactonase YvrE
MTRRLIRVLVLSAVAAALVVSQGAPIASGEESDGPVGYTFGESLRNGTVEVGQCNFYELDVERAEIQQVNPAGQQVFCGDGLTFDDDGTLYAYRNQNLFGNGVHTELIEVDPEDGSQQVIGSLPKVLLGSAGMTFDADGDLWLYGFALDDPQCPPQGGVCLWEVNPKNAHSRFVGAASPGVGVFGLTADCEEVLAITGNFATGPGVSAQLQEVNTSNASLEKIADVPSIARPEGLDFDSEGDLWAISGGGPLAGIADGPTVYKIDPNNGNTGGKNITLEGGGAFNDLLFGLAVSSIECDEPEPPAPLQPAPVVLAPTFTG